uniref:Uncharacterized protein n=1 Tax=Magallana gigas TaxID=29159 RepID=K1R6B1_MAGGI
MFVVVCIPTPEFNIVSFNSTLDCLCKSLSEINGADLEGNQISRINNNTFKGLPQLETLDLRSNQISRIDNNTFKGLPQLETLGYKIKWVSTLSMIKIYETKNIYFA